MLTMPEAAREFLAQKSIAVAGVSRSGTEAANAVYCKLRSLGYNVFAVNPNATTVEGDPCYPDLKSIPATVDGVVVLVMARWTKYFTFDQRSVIISGVSCGDTVYPRGFQLTPVTRLGHCIR